MPERNPTAKPTVICGTNLESGTPNTGQIQYTLGGTKTFTKYSGTAGGDANIHAGGGRLDGVFIIPNSLLAVSGQAVLFYDAAAAVSGGPLATSGHKVLGGFSMPPVPTPSSGVTVLGGYIPLGMPYSSGLCHTSTSGAFGFTATYTPCVSGA